MVLTGVGDYAYLLNALRGMGLTAHPPAGNY